MPPHYKAVICSHGRSSKNYFIVSSALRVRMLDSPGDHTDCGLKLNEQEFDEFIRKLQQHTSAKSAINMEDFLAFIER